MAFLTRNAGVLAFQLVARQPMIELFLRWLPMDQTEVFSVVVQVAVHAVLAVRAFHLQARMVAVVRSQPSRYLFVAIEALEGRHAGAKLMATRALRGTRQGLMSFGKRPRRDLRVGRSRKEG